MFWPSAQDYNEAIQAPSICFSDEELRKGSIDLTVLGLPKVMSGAFASVYKIDSGNNSWAVRCFLNCRSDQQQRYRAISDFVLFDDLECTVPFYYLDQGIKIKGKWYPILKMQWVEGLTFDRFIEQHFRNQKYIIELLRQFDAMALDLLRAGIAHGDLQHGNIIVTNGGLRLVDYDAFYVPALDGLSSPEVGHPNYQHPQRGASQFNSAIDNFSVWVIHLALLAISIDPELYRLVEGGDDCILFKHVDLKNPGKSALFRLLLEHPSCELRQSANLILRFLALAPKTVPNLSATQEEISRLSEPFLGTQQIGDEQEGQREPVSIADVIFDSGRRLTPLERSVLPVFESDNVNVNVQFAIAKRNFSNALSVSWNSWFVRNLPTLWCELKLKRANRYFESGQYECASQRYLQLTEVYEFLATHKNLWKSLLRVGRPLWLFIAIYSAMILSFLACQKLPALVVFAFWYLFVVIATVLRMHLKRLDPLRRDPAKLLVVSLLRLGYCFGFANQWKVASNYFMMAARQCKWGIDPALRQRSLALYAFARNEAQDHREALRFLLIRPEVIERLPEIVSGENAEGSLLMRTSAFELMADLAAHYFKQKLPYSAQPPLFAARSLYKVLAGSVEPAVSLEAMDIYLMIAYIHVRKSEWSLAHITLNSLIELASTMQDTHPHRLRGSHIFALRLPKIFMAILPLQLP